MKPQEIHSVFICPGCHSQITLAVVNKDILEDIQVYCNSCKKKFLPLSLATETRKGTSTSIDMKIIGATQDNLAIPSQRKSTYTSTDFAVKDVPSQKEEIFPDTKEKITKVANYSIIKEIGRGAMGVIYMAEHAETKKRAAIKLLNQDMQNNEKATQRFLQEAKVHSKLVHPNIVHIYEMGYFTGAGFYMAMEYVEGYSLEKILQKGPLSIKDAFKIAIAIAYALEYALTQHIIHRDLKPGNILIDTVGRKIKVADFGLGKILQEEGVTVNEFLGTPYYMPPEQIKDAKQVDQRADIYALGATLYHMIAGCPPYSEKKATFAVIRAKTQELPSPLEKYIPSIPSHVVGVVDKAMAKDLETRYANPTAFLTDMQKVLETLK